MPKSQASFTKKEKEKKRLQKRQEKEERKKERQANNSKGKSLEDMMAYIDENGNITSTPPDPTKKRVIKTDDIVIGARNMGDNKQTNSLRIGKVTFFNSSKGYGFIKDSQSQESIFVHANSLTTLIKENDTVSFMVENGPRGLSATNVKKA
jgi:cold shock CspA family protein